MAEGFRGTSQIGNSGRRRPIDQMSPGGSTWNIDLDSTLKNQGVRYGMPYATLDDLINYFDVSRLPDYMGAPMPLVGHIIFTRPSLYVDTGMRGYGDDIARNNYTAMCQNAMTAAFATDINGKKLLHSLTEFSTNPYLPLFTTRSINYTVNDMSLKTVEKAQTYFGHVLKYGKHSEEHKIGGTFTMDFRNDRYNSVLKTVHLWAAYIWITSKNDSIAPSDSSQKNGILDYAGSVYYLVTNMNSRSLVYWEKLTGVFPKTIPFSIFSYNDQPILEDKISVEFDYGVRSDPNDPDVLFDLNVLSCNSMEEAEKRWMKGAMDLDTLIPTFGTVEEGKKARELYVRPDSYERPFGLGNAFALRPLVQMIKKNGSINYELQFTTKIY